ncbi:uncharacterized protein MONOS_14009 [Monocercomonoides exilis]|uniref:uncharacterized protein n=1 Tax=Monocercomonoides exilis TaxID=2049356 RepID=UPI00355A3C32|nr:hypothetical protein MONOS_14009 [Monocercomonoides exilis]|eukprot:MONOS_14009.1-p1 / transcript=MONOS_14009.1 / gene=MONOS_14009 / organism=Monocercomonoides_exilis_PA203 / gene_product=unspecified product / transcript_product=unspecified product / location=Mono_scaffold00921:1906-3254(+) / protein_length=360 / sequence_SO=supercontig / SO=protein_coding / is_pseudo=false
MANAVRSYGNVAIEELEERTTKKNKQIEIERVRKLEDEKDSDWDSEEQEVQEEMERKQDFSSIFHREWLTPRRQASELRKFIEFCKAGSIRISDDILNSFIPESEKEFFTGHTDTSLNALARTAITAKGRGESPEASRAIKLLQPAMESGFEAAKAIATSQRVLGDQWIALAFIKQWEKRQGTVHPPLLPQPSALSQPGVVAQEDVVQKGMLRASPTDSSKNVASMGASQISKKEGCQHMYYHSMPLHQLGEWPRSLFTSPQLPRGYREDQQQEQLLEQANVPRRRESRALLLDKERGESIASPRKQRRCTEPIRSREEYKSMNLKRPRERIMEREHRRRLRISPKDKTEELGEIREGG